MPAITAANLQFRLSGGIANANPSLSLGGEMSDTVMASQTVAPPVAITGVTFTYAGGLGIGGADNALRHTVTGGQHTLALAGPGDMTFGTPVDVTAGGEFFLSGVSRGSVGVWVTPANLPATSQDENIIATNIKNNLFDDVTKLDALNGMSDYRCIYLYNNHPTDSFLQVEIYGNGPNGNIAAAGDRFYVGACTGPEISSGSGRNGDRVAGTIATENDAPAGIVFSSPYSPYNLNLGVIRPLEARAIWLRRDVPAQMYATTPDDYVSFGLKLIF